MLRVLLLTAISALTFGQIFGQDNPIQVTESGLSLIHI